MATNIFKISPYFTFEWWDTAATNPYNTDPLNDLDVDVDYRQPIQCGGGGYQSDTGQIQLISDFVPTCGLYRWDNVFIKDIPLTAIDPPIIGNITIDGVTAPITFICYNGGVDFSDVDPDLYYCKITYTDELESDRDWRTTPLDVQIFHDGTQLIQATNTKNDKGVVFVKSDATLLMINLRVASYLYLPTPKTDAEDYEDQYNTLTQENSIPFLTVTQILGGPLLLPFWLIKRINLLYSLNQVLIDGNPFTKIAKSEFRPKRADFGNMGAIWEVDLQPNDAGPSDQFITGDLSGGDYIVIKQAKTFKNQSADFAFAGNFTAGKNLIRIAVVNNGGDVFTMNIGTTDGGTELGIINFPDDNTDSIDIGKLFKVPTTVYISGITGTDLDITFDWNDYFAKDLMPGTAASKWQKGTLYYFVEVPGGPVFTDEFDVGTGLGQVGSDHEGCVLAGTNGTPTLTGLLVRGWNNAEVLPAATRQTVIGDNSVTIGLNQLPEHSHFGFNGDSQNSSGNDITPTNGYARMQRNAGINRDYNIAASGTLPDRGPGSPVGAGDPVDVTNAALILPAFYYVGT